MLDIKFIRENPDLVKNAAQSKKANVNIDQLLDLDTERRSLQQTINDLNQQRNEAAKAKDIERGKKLKLELEEVEKKFAEVDAEFLDLLELVPNIPSSDTPVGPDESANVVLRKWGEPKKFDFQPKEHWELGKELDVIDTDRAAKVSGARFAYLKGAVAMMELALVQLALSVLTDEDQLKKIAKKAGLDVSTKPFIPVIPPDMVKRESMWKMARLKPEEERYYIPSDDLYLVGSAEHSLGAMHMDETFKEEDLPLRYVGLSPAFRREAGSYGKDMKGILRVHQFEKLEIMSFTAPERGLDEQKFIVAIQEHLMQLLELPYQVVAISTGDMGGPDHRQVDLETWLPGQDKYRETHTSDYNTDYQSRRLNTKVKREDGKTELVHMNDATVFSGRPIIAILENYQQEDGSVKIPKALQPYMFGLKEIKK